ncbi:hypothetical protein QFC22_001253 [Naganishia vaughanmartiniae]|uniref:Uncharacterized protein n=1 Tax=Naganishia vaughanmartiniae TaxID=1424756 RepID=A0ACC2XI14_9TREE|nr:hypothetical protein QFC22_001253 [Naganishia vaughanmartiniae]
MIPATPLRATQFGSMIAATPAFEREEDQRLIGQILESMNTNLNANAPNGEERQEQATSAAQEQDPAHWNVTMKALVQISILDMLAKWTSHAKDSDREKQALDVSLKLVQSVLRTMKNKFQADSRLLFSGASENEAGGTVTQGSGDNIPLYRWLLPRLCFAASEFQANALLRPYVDETLDLAAYLVDSVGQYLDTQASEGAMGLYLGKSLISGLSSSCIGRFHFALEYHTVRANNIGSELLNLDSSEQRDSFTIQTVAPEKKKYQISSQQQKELVKGDNSPHYTMPYPTGHSRINLGLAVAQVILRSTYQPLHSVPHWSLTSGSDFASVITSLCRVGRAVLVKADLIGQAERINEKGQTIAFYQLERIAATAESLCTHTRTDLPPLPREFFHITVELCAGRLLDRLKVGEGSVNPEAQQLLRLIDESMIKTLHAIRIHKMGRAGGMFWDLLADRWIHDVKVKFVGEEAVDRMPTETRRLWIAATCALVLPLAANPVLIAQVLDSSDVMLIEHATNIVHGLSDAEQSLNRKLATAARAINFGYGNAPLSTRGTKRKRNQDDIALQNRATLNGNMQPAGLQLLVIGEDEVNAGLNGRNQIPDVDGMQQQANHSHDSISLLHSDEVHQHCVNDVDFGDWVHSRWDPVVQSLVQCLSEDALKDQDYMQQRNIWQDEWTKKDSAAISVMMRKEPSVLVNQIYSRIETLGRSFPFNDKAKTLNLFKTLRKLCRDFSRLYGRPSKSKQNTAQRYIGAKQITILCGFISKAWKSINRDAEIDIAFFFLLKDTLNCMAPEMASTTFLSPAQCRRLIDCFKTGFAVEDRSTKVAIGGSAVAFVKGWYHNGFQESASTLIEPLVDMFAAEGDPAHPFKAEPAISIMGELAKATFLRQNYPYILPYGVLQRDAGMIRHAYAAGNNEGSLGSLLINHNSDILAEIFTHESGDRLRDTLNFYRSQVQGDNDTQVTIARLITLSVAPLLVRVIVRMCKSESSNAVLKALQRVHQFSHQDAKRQSTRNEVIIFLKQHMLGIISELNDMLHDMHEKKTIKQKLDVISSYEALITLAGSTMAVYSPQGTIWVPQLRFEALKAWRAYATQLKFADIGPYIGYTVAAFVSVWHHMSPEEKDVGSETINYLIVEHASSLHQYLDNVVDLSGIPELVKAAVCLKEMRSKQTLRERLQELLKRCSDDNVAVCERSLSELRDILSGSSREISRFFRGDSFDPISSAIYRVLLMAAGRDGEACQGIRDASYDCMGTLGALDPDRFKLDVSETPILLSYNFGGYEESSDFAICLIQTSLISAYKTTTDTRYQAHLAYAIQELLKFCGFSPDLFDDNIKGRGSHSIKVRERWRAFPQHMLDTIAPLLEGRYVYPKDLPVVHFPHPVYANTSTYRQWLQRWTIDLLGNVLEAPEPKGSATDPKVIAVKNSKIIFGAFHSVLKSSQDVGVAHHILPHLILYLLFSKGSEIRLQIAVEIRAVLSDLVNHRNEVHRDRQNLSAQAVFDLLDHFSRWVQHQKTVIIRDYRGGRIEKINDPERRAEYQYLMEQIPKVEGLLNSIDAELQAEAALITQAYARSLRGFETRMAALRRSQKRTDADLQPYYEYLHRIYADLDEPDGMEGVSTFIISPSMDHQIREHESVGRWTSAQSCWEVKLQDNADNLDLHLGLLRCLRSLGHYDTLRTHIEGIISRHPEWSPDLANYRVEATWIVQDWHGLSDILQSGAKGPEISKARVLQAISQKDFDSIPGLLKDARREIGSTISANHRTYVRNYSALLDLHMLHEIDQIQSTSTELVMKAQHISEANKDTFRRTHIFELKQTLLNRLSTISPSFKYQEPVLSMRRAGFNLVPNALAELKNERGMAWLTTSKIARKAGHVQTAYSAILQAGALHAPFTFVQQAKLMRANGQPLKALSELENVLPTLRLDLGIAGSSVHPIPLEADPAQNKDSIALAKALSLSARWAFETERLDANDIIKRFQQAIKLAPEQESPFYHLGHYYDQYAESSKHTENIDSLRLKVCENYALSLRYGVKYIYRTMPRMLTLWLDLGESTATERKTKNPSNAAGVVERINKTMDVARRELPRYLWLIAFGQIVARIAHPNKTVAAVLLKIMRDVLREYTRQAIWSFVGSYHSRDATSSKARNCQQLFLTIKSGDAIGSNAQKIIDSAIAFSSMLLRLSEDPGIDKDWDPVKNRKEKPNHNKLHLTISANFPYASRVFPSEMIMPLQDALTCTLPSSSETLKTHNPFMQGYVTIKGKSTRAPLQKCEMRLSLISLGMHDDIEVMPSLQRPKKLCFIGDNGRKYNFLAKPEDDLRKDARLMEFNSMINKLLKGNTETRRRNLYIRTYAVMPLNEECGLLEWVNNTVPLRSILTKLYEREKKKVFSNAIYSELDAARVAGPAEAAKVFKQKILPQFAPYVFHQWFFEMWPEPNAWLAARIAYARTLAVMSIVGFVLGLGDRHGENILFDSTTGDTVHVDFNCLFEKGKGFAVPERVPFRLTANMVDALGATGYEGIFRRAAEVTFGELRTNRDSLTSVLEAFIHDPLTEWQAAKDRAGRKSKSASNAVDFRQIAAKALDPIRWKLKGTMGESGDGEMSVTNQVDTLIKEATSPVNLGQMYVGWASWL